MFAISAGILLAAQSGCIGATLAGTDGSYNTPDTELSVHAPVQAVTAGERMPDLSVACQIADTFADMLFTGVLDVAYAVHAVLGLTAVDNITYDDDNSLVLDGASDITTFVSGGHTYAAVAAFVDSGVQILNITNPANITAAGNIADIGEFTPDLELRGARGITTFVSGGHTYAAVAADRSDGVQILNITDPLRITAAGNTADIGTNTDSLVLNGARGITTFVSGGHTYAAVAAYLDNGVQILNITDPSNITAAGNITNTDTLELEGASGIATFESGDHTYVAVAAYLDNGVQILDVTDPLHIIPAGNITKIGSNTDDLELNGAYGITTFVSGGHTYAAVAAHFDDGVQILNITDPLHITPAGSIDTNTLKLNGAQGITTFTSGDRRYVAVAAYIGNGVQILDVTDPLRIVPAGNIEDAGTNTDGLELHRAQGITTFTSGDHTYVAVAAHFDDGVQILRIDITEPDTTPPTVQAGDDQTVGEGDTVTLSGSATDTDDDPITYTWSQTNPDAHLITFVNASAPLTTFTAPDVTGDTTFTITLTADDGTQSVEDTLKITVKETSAAFITTWTASDSDRGITLPMDGTYSVLWGDGSNSTNVSNSQLHSYDVAGTYNVTVLGDDLKYIRLSGDITNALQLESIEQWGGTEWTTMYDAFDGAANMVYRATDAPNLSNVTSTSGMFWSASSFDGDLSGWNVSNVTNMFNMFSSASSFNQTLNSWDVSSVIDMSYMFEGASSFDQPLNDWDVSSVTDMSSMFEDASSFNQPLNRWNVSSVIRMGMIFMFHNADDFDQNLGNWYVVLNSTSIASSNVPGVVGSISAQNMHLDSHTPVYNVTGSDSTRFAIVNGNQLNMTSVNNTKSTYTVNVTASKGTVFEDGNNWRILDVTVTTTADDTPPDMILDGSDYITITVGATYADEGATCYDRVDGDIDVTVDGDRFDTSMPGRYTVTYSCTDAAGNEATELTRTVVVEALPPLVITIQGSNPVTITVDMTYIDEGATCKNNVDGSIPILIDDSNTVNTSIVGNYTVTYTCFASIFVEAYRTVIVTATATADDKPPVIALIRPGTFTTTVDTLYTDAGATCTDDVDGSITPTQTSTVDTSTAGPYTVTYSCTDAANNDATPVSRTVTVMETVGAFITTWVATDSDRGITLPMTGTYSVLWGDGSHDAVVINSTSHTYGTAGTYTVTVLGEGLKSVDLYGDTQTQNSSGLLNSGAARNGPPCTRRLRGRQTWCTVQLMRRTCPESPT